MMNRDYIIKNKSNLSGANLWRADLAGVNLWRADLSGANLSQADLSGANLWRANLWRADLWRADLAGANLAGANLAGANLSGANLSGANLPKFQIPQEGSLVVWKKLEGGVLCKMLILEEAQRTATLVGRKCRAEYVKVLELVNCYESVACDKHTGNTRYEVGKITRPDSYNNDIRIECTHGIHFFLTREEAEEY